MIPTPLILLADDNPDDQSFIRDAFAYVQANVTLRILDNGHDLLQYLQAMQIKELPALIVLDYNMPKLNGAEVLQRLLKEKRYEHVPKIILSTSFYQDHINYCMKMGADGYLIKPDNVFLWKQIALKMLSYIKEPKLMAESVEA